MVACVRAWAFVLLPFPSPCGGRSCRQFPVLMKPTEWTLRGGVDMARSRLTGVMTRDWGSLNVWMKSSNQVMGRHLM